MSRGIGGDTLMIYGFDGKQNNSGTEVMDLCAVFLRYHCTNADFLSKPCSFSLRRSPSKVFNAGIFFIPESYSSLRKLFPPIRQISLIIVT